MNDRKTWIDQLEQLIQRKHMLSHPFYKAWTCGQLTRKQLQEYAKEYYHHVKAFPAYLSILHSRCEDLEARKCLLQNLIDEEMGNPNHPDLWRSFALALGITQDELNTHQPAITTQSLIQTFKHSCSSFSLAAGVAALYCYESQIPEICQTKIKGLKEWYGMNNPADYRYFSVHEEADIEHSAAEKKILKSLVKSEKEEREVLKTAGNVLEALDEFLSSFVNMRLKVVVEDEEECMS